MQSTTSRPSRALIVVAFAAVYLVWGSTFLAIRFAIETLPPFLMAATRFMIAGTILLSWAIFRGEWSLPSLAQWSRALIVGGLLLLCGNGGVTWAEKYMASSLAALSVATEPLWVVVLNWAITRKRPNSKVLLGVLIGLAGVALLVSDGLKRLEGDKWLSLISGGVVLLASFAWAAGSVYANRRPIQASTSMAAGMQMLSGGGLLLILAIVAGDFPRLNFSNTSWTSVIAFCYLLVFGSLVGFTAYSWLLRNVSTASAATYAYVNPVVAVFLGWLIAAEPLTPRMLSAAAVIVGSVVLITTFGHEHDSDSVPSLHDTDFPTAPCA